MAKVIEYPRVGATYHTEAFGVYAYSTYPRGSVLEGQERRSALGQYDLLAEAQREHPDAIWHGEHVGYTERPISHIPPEWFDPSIAGETWDDENY